MATYECNNCGMSVNATCGKCNSQLVDDSIEVEGTVREALPNANFKIELANGHEVLAHVSGKIRMNFIRVIPGDRVLVEHSPYDLTRGRITYRFK